MILDSPIISGSASIAGDLTVGGIVYANVNGTASYASNSDLLDGLDSSVFTISSSFNAYTSSVSSSFSVLEAGIATASAAFNVRISTIESKYATTGSNQFNGNQVVTGSLTVTGQVIAQTLNVQQVTSSVVYSSGSNVFGNNISNTHQFTGSVLVTGSVVASSIARTGGTSNQFLKADGTVDSSVYATTSSLTNYVNLTEDQNINGRKSFIQGQIWFGSNQSGQSIVGGSSGISFGNSNSLGGTSNIVLGFESNSSGTQGISIGNNANSGNSSAYNNIAIGQKATEFISSGNNNIAIGRLAANGISTGSGNIAFGSSAGSYIVGSLFQLQTNTNSVFIGNGTRGSANGNTNEIVIGEAALGNGSNTVTIGNSSITNNYFTGNIRGGAFIRSGGTSSQFLKADGSVDGTSYATAASISGTTNYIPKFTSSSAIGNSQIFDNGTNVGIGTTSPSSISGYTVLSLNNATNGGMLDLKSNGTSLGFIYAFDNSINIGSNGTAPINFLTASGNQRGQWASDGTFLINTTTTDGTNKLIVNGGVKGGAFTGTTATFLSGSGTTEALIVGGAGGVGSTRQGELKFGDAGNIYKIQGGQDYEAMNFITNNVVRFSIAAAGAATFSSSVTAGQVNNVANGTTTYSTFNATNSSSTANIFIGVGGSAVANTPLRNNAYVMNTANSSLILGTNDQARVTIDNTGAATFSSLGTGTVYSNSGTLTNTNPSDRNLKTDIAQITYGLGDILKLNPVTFNWKDDKINQGKQYGFIAQEVQEIMPDLVKEGDYLGLDKEAIFTILVKAVQELKAELDELKANK